MTSLMPMVRKLELWKPLSERDRTAILDLPHEAESLGRGGYIIRERQETDHACLLLSGFVFRQKVTGNGGRSISAVHMPGDIVSLHSSLVGLADHSVQALGEVTYARIPGEAVVELAFAHPAIGMAMWHGTLVDAAIFCEWMLNVARRQAATRIAHLLCEFGVRLELLGLGERATFELPMTQEELADATGLTQVHVNRSLRELEERGLIARTMRFVSVGDWPDLTRFAEFDDTYLHLHNQP